MAIARQLSAAKDRSTRCRKRQVFKTIKLVSKSEAHVAVLPRTGHGDGLQVQILQTQQSKRCIASSLAEIYFAMAYTPVL